jgi:hypothetical protein
VTFLAFNEIHDTGRTKVWEVRNSNDGSYLGVVKWHGAWRKYVLDSAVYASRAPHSSHLAPIRRDVALPTVWSEDCLRDVAQFIKIQMHLRQEGREKK